MPNERDTWLTTREAALRTKLSIETIRRHARAGNIPAYTAGNRLRFRAEDIDGFLAPANDLARTSHGAV